MDGGYETQLNFGSGAWPGEEGKYMHLGVAREPGGPMQTHSCVCLFRYLFSLCYVPVSGLLVLDL